MTTEQLKQFVANNDFGYAETTGLFCAICDNEARQYVLNVLDRCNSPEEVGGAELDDVLEQHPEFRNELANGCTIYACEEYNEATKINTHWIAYYS